MKYKFLPKALDGIGGVRACLDIGRGVASTEPHFHDCAEIVYMKSGSMRVFLDLEWMTIGEGEALFVPPGVIHSTDCRDDGACRAVLGFHDDLIAAKGTDEYYELMPYLASKFNTGYVISAKTAPEIATSFDRMLAEADTSHSIGRLKLYSEVITVYRAFLTEWRRMGLIDWRRTKNPLAQRIEDYVRENCRMPLTATEVAGVMNVSYSYMARLLSESLGYGFSELLLLSRTETAKILLTSTDLSVTDVGFECGFSTTSAFIQTFRARTGKTPLAYRKNATKK